MQWWEVNRYLNGIQRRKRTQWETTREIQWYLACIHWSDKGGPKPQKSQDLYKFPWEKEEVQAPDITEEEIREMQELMENYQF